jgi:hypothetical protein
MINRERDTFPHSRHHQAIGFPLPPERDRKSLYAEITDKGVRLSVNLLNPVTTRRCQIRYSGPLPLDSVAEHLRDACAVSWRAPARPDRVDALTATGVIRAVPDVPEAGAP